MSDDFQQRLSDVINRASDLVGWTVVEVWFDDESECVIGEGMEYEWGVGLVLTRGDERKRVWLNSFGATDGSSCIAFDARKGMWDHAELRIAL